MHIDESDGYFGTKKCTKMYWIFCAKYVAYAVGLKIDYCSERAVIVGSFFNTNLESICHNSCGADTRRSCAILCNILQERLVLRPIQHFA